MSIICDLQRHHHLTIFGSRHFCDGFAALVISNPAAETRNINIFRGVRNPTPILSETFAALSQRLNLIIVFIFIMNQPRRFCQHFYLHIKEE